MADRPRIILVEDDDGHATLVRRNLRRAGVEHDPVHLRDGQDLLDYLRRRARWSERRPDPAVTIILDLNMPRLGGMEVLRELKRDDELARIPVFVLTTTDNPAEIDRCYVLGAAVCLVKPVDYGAFGGMVQRLAEFLSVAHMPGEMPFPPVPYGS
jgi:CheY-like chemotaxis protein